MNRRTILEVSSRSLAVAALLLFLLPLSGRSQERDAAGGAVRADADLDVRGADDELFADDELSDEDDLFGDEPIDEEDDEAQADRATPEDAQAAPEEAMPDAESEVLEGTRFEDSESQSTLTQGIEEILVTGEATQGAVMEASTSGVTFDSSDLEAMGVKDVSDLAAFTPNLEINSPGSSTATFFIRGVGLSDFSANAAGAVAIYQDDVALNSPPLQVAQIFDVENILVDRGPQGSGSGRNASAGAIRIYSRKPAGEHAARLRVSLGKFESNDIHDALTQDYEGAIDLPLLVDTLSSRFAFRYTQSDPFFTNRCGVAPPFAARSGGQLGAICGESVTSAPNPPISFEDRRIRPGLPRHLGDRDVWALRGALRFQPPDTDMDWILNVHGSRREQDGSVGQAIGGGRNTTTGVVFGGATLSGYIEPDSAEEQRKLVARGIPGRVATGIRGTRQAETRPLDIRPFDGDYNRIGHNRLETYGGFLRGELEFQNWQLRTTTAYDGYERDVATDTDMTPNVLFETAQHNQSWQVFQELYAEGELEALPLTWKTGGYVLVEDLDVESSVKLDAELFNIVRNYQQNLTSFAVHAGIAWELLDDFTLDMGGRYNFSRKDFKIDQVNPILQMSTNTLAVDHRDEVWDHFSGSVGLTYHFSDASSVYAKYNHGWKSGHLNSNGIPREPASPEKIDALEIGTHAEYLDGRIGVGAAVFYYNYEDYQVFIFEDNPGNGNPPTLEIINANDAQLFGVEADLTLRPLEDTLEFIPDALQGLEIQLLFSWLDSQFLDFQNEQFVDGGGGGTIPILVNYSGNQLPNAPKLNLSGYVRWPIDLGKYGELLPRWDFAFKDDVFFDPSQGRGSVRFLPTGALATGPEFAVGQPAYWLHNVRIGWRSADGHTGIAGWCRNVFDERYKSFVFDASRVQSVVLNFVGDPRSCGVELNFTW